MNAWMFAGGLALLGLAFVDLVWTTIAVSGGRGPLTHVVGSGVWRLAVRMRRHRLLQWAGYLVILLVPLLWVGLVLVGFALLFLSDPGSVRQASPPYGAASTVATVAYATGGLAGAGAGYVAGGPWWQLLNNLSALAGLGLFTFGLTYLFQVVTAVTAQRALASTIDGLGDDPVDVLAAALREPALGQLPSKLTTISTALDQISRKRVALPILQFFHVGSRSQSIALNVAVFDEIVTLLDVVLEAPHVTVVRPARQAVDAYVDTTQLALRRSPPPIPDLSSLPEDPAQGTRDPEAAAAAMRGLADRRAALHAMIAQEAWTWSDVYPDAGLVTSGSRTGEDGGGGGDG